MAKGLVTSVSETGRDEDAGRMRLTFRYRARVWRVVVEADGTLVEDPLPAGKPGHAKDPFSLLIPEQAAPLFRNDGAPLFRSIAAQRSD